MVFDCLQIEIHVDSLENNNFCFPWLSLYAKMLFIHHKQQAQRYSASVKNLHSFSCVCLDICCYLSVLRALYFFGQLSELEVSIFVSLLSSSSSV